MNKLLDEKPNSFSLTKKKNESKIKRSKTPKVSKASHRKLLFYINLKYSNL